MFGFLRGGLRETAGKLSERKASLKIIEGNRETIANGPLTFTSAITVFPRYIELEMMILACATVGSPNSQETMRVSWRINISSMRPNRVGAH